MDSTSRVLVVGADGLIGSALARRFRADGREVVATSRHAERGLPPLDLAREASSWPLPPGIAIAYLCAAVTSAEACRSMESHAWAVNVEGTTDLARRLIEGGATVVFLSSNMVFDGTVPRTRADAATCPGTAYGRMKAEAERRLLAIGERVWIVRMTKVLGTAVPLFSRWHRSLAGGEPIHPFLDKVMAPMTVDFAVDVLTQLPRRIDRGILQVSATDDVRYVEVAERLARVIGATPRLVQPIRPDDAATAPLHTTLDMSRLQDDFGIAAPAPWEAIEKAIGTFPPLA
jgi:dTDP-4-dehydrorhamnose reductase